MARFKRPKPPKPGDAYRKIWRQVDGGITDCFNHHPEYLPLGKRMISNLRISLLKRITGSILASAGQPAKRRTRKSWAAKRASACTVRVEADGVAKRTVAALALRRGVGSLEMDPAPYDWMADFAGSYNLAIAAMRRDGVITGRFEPQNHAEYLLTLRS